MAKKKATRTGAGTSPKVRKAGQKPHAQGAAAGKPEVVVVGIGTSAGGLAALRAFFRNVDDDSGLAYVVVMHLSPEHESHLADLLQPHSKMTVQQVKKTIALEPNCVYVIPPNANLSAIDTHLRLSQLEERRASRAPIDHFFRTLAEVHDGHTIGVVLTGTGSDGTLGVKEIKLRGGLTVAQDPKEAEYDSMPQSAISAGFVDIVLPVEQIPHAVLRWSRTDPRLPTHSADSQTLLPEQSILLRKVFTHVRARTARDFSRYKRSTVLRRIQRRMQLRYIEELDRYVDLLRESPEEVSALSDDLLITVTSFFRDPEVFERLEKDVIPKLLEERGADDAIRVWCAGCATGEEVYSVAMLFVENMTALGGLAPRLQFFASDLHKRSLEIAREGFYPGDIAGALSPQRLKRFFVEESGGFRVRKELRELVVFAPHNLLADPPFSHLDLLVCRNLMIYLQREVQADVLRIFHYALKPGGYLVLGTSETVEDGELFRAVDKKHAVFQRGQAQMPELHLPLFPLARREPGEAEARSVTGLPPQRYEALHQQMVNRNALPSALIGPDGQIVFLSRDAGRYFEHPGGQLTSHASKLVRKELSSELVTALHAARHQGEPVRTRPLPVRFNGESRPVVMHLQATGEDQGAGYTLVSFQEMDGSPPAAAPGDGDGQARELTQELDLTRRRLQGLIEEFESGQEEMRSSNEELQSTNEELRSTLEELETSKEELQSVNEELQTVNQENRHKVEELAILSGDLQNLLTATDIATLFLDRELRILRFTPKVTELFNMRMTDRGRPISDLTHRLGYPDLANDAEVVLRRLTLIEREVKDEQGRWYMTRLLPYRSREDRIEGVVITFFDITRRKNIEDEVQILTRTLEARVTERTHQVRQLTTSLVRAEQRERRRLSETLHDELQQLLFSVQLKLRLSREAGTGGLKDERDQHLQQAEEMLRRSAHVTRRISVDLNPPILRNEGLRSILAWLQVHMRELHGLDVSIEAEREVMIEDADARVLLFQALRELLFNVAKHSATDKAVVALSAANGDVRIDVSDKGRGFDTGILSPNPEAPAKLGLMNVQERTKLLGGRVSFESTPGLGSRMSLIVPLDTRIADT